MRVLHCSLRACVRACVPVGGVQSHFAQTCCWKRARSRVREPSNSTTTTTKTSTTSFKCVRTHTTHSSPTPIDADTHTNSRSADNQLARITSLKNMHALVVARDSITSHTTDSPPHIPHTPHALLKPIHINTKAAKHRYAPDMDKIASISQRMDPSSSAQRAQHSTQTKQNGRHNVCRLFFLLASRRWLRFNVVSADALLSK